jgi:Flp pilus assembly protein protease CpaA
MLKIIPFVLIIIAGMLTSYTDLTEKKIYNSHIIVLTVLAIIFFFLALLTTKALPSLNIYSGLAGLTIAVIFHVKKLWRPGDAKLFILYAFLMPATGYEKILPLPCLVLFALTFTLSLAWLIPQAITRKHIQSLFCQGSARTLIFSFLVTLTLSWVMFPLIEITGITRYIFPSFVLINILFLALRKWLKMIQPYPFLLIFIFAIGLLTRLYLSPQFFSSGQILRYAQTVLIYSLSFHALTRLIPFIRAQEQRIPFSPFLFLGCLLSYTPVLRWLLTILRLQ